MRYLLFIILISPFLQSANNKEWEDGEFEYTMVFDEWGPGVLESTCRVIIKGDSITVIHDGNRHLTGDEGDVMDKGKIMKHKKTGKWIIAHSPDDVNAVDIGGCTDGPTIIEFDTRIYHAC